MNVHMIRQNYGKKQITLHAMTGSQFKALFNALKQDSETSVERAAQC